jgi:hypothetical protein
VKINLVFLDWKKKGKSIYSTLTGVKLSKGDFHSGTTFAGEIELESPEAEELKKALRKGYQPCFWIAQERKEKP